MRLTSLSLFLLLAALPLPAHAQWRLGPGLMTEHFGGVSEGPLDEEAGEVLASFRPAPTTVWSLRYERPRGRWHWAVEARLARPVTSIVSDQARLTLGGPLTTVLGLLPQIVVRVAQLSEHARLEAEAGPLVEGWIESEADSRLIVSGVAGAGLAVEVTPRVAARLGIRLGWTPASVVEVGGLEGWSARATWRRGVSGSVLIGF